MEPLYWNVINILDTQNVSLKDKETLKQVN